MLNSLKHVLILLGVSIAFAGLVRADGLLDGRVFQGVIGPAGAPDLQDSLYFADGHFWSDICTRCGFVPGIYKVHQTGQGITFTGVLESDSRGRFEYHGLITAEGNIDVTIQWTRERWYWTARRTIVFAGAEVLHPQEVSLIEMNAMMHSFDPDNTPICARF